VFRELQLMGVLSQGLVRRFHDVCYVSGDAS
jgi:hypothetical protein